jgi:hypothetical protein
MSASGMTLHIIRARAEPGPGILTEYRFRLPVISSVLQRRAKLNHPSEESGPSQAPDLGSYGAFLRMWLTRLPGVHGVRSAFALRRMIYRTNLPLKPKR